MPPLPLSIAIVCKNNRRSLEPVLMSIRGLAAEIVAVDSGSTDGTIELLESAGARVIRSEWKGHIATKQMAMDLCTQPWILSIDSDEPVLSDLAEAMRAAIERDDPGVAGYRVNRKVWYLDQPLDHAWQPEWRLRLVRRGKARWGGVNPHDKLDILPSAGRVENLAGTLRHDSFTNMADYLTKQVNLSRISAESLVAQGKRGSYLRLVISPAAAFLKQFIARGAWRDGWRGWCAAGATAVATAMKHLMLIEMSSRGAASRDTSAE
ncbi:MAG TPA: glycosyltransferase family 2 protein [Phycisphaerales bacterium]|nr:glycosyltransferase family 2 protein [Phycisphaerales bacterium]